MSTPHPNFLINLNSLFLYIVINMKKTVILLLLLSIYSVSHGSDTLYFHLSNPYKTEKSADGKYFRKAIFTKDSGWFALDYNDSNRLVLRGYYTDTTFATRNFQHFYYGEKGGVHMIRSYKNGKPDGINAEFNDKGDTVWRQTFAAGKLTSTWTRKDYEQKEITFSIVEQSAEFTGGPSRWGFYLNKNLVYPKAAIKKEIEGIVHVLFVVGSDGEVSGVQIRKSIHPLLDEEAMRLIKSSPRWKPAMWDGIKVAQYLIQPVVFRLE
jgi:TonB family protein